MSGRVLIYDGDTARLGRLAQAVTLAGGEPFEVSSAAAAVRAAASCELVLLAGEEGIGALAAISAAHPTLPRITIVGPVNAADAERLVIAIRGALVHHRPSAPDFETLTRDRLTGAIGWHYFRLRLVEELDRAARYNRALSLLLVDLDDLRGLNDRLGRAAGDFALAQVATALISGARSVDFVGRWAGGAFALLLPETAVGAAYGLAERLRADLAARRLPAPPQLLHPSRPLRVTMSCGVASLYKDGTAHAGTLVARADHALWRAKLGGRNRSIVD
ncbi:MAG TPA: GGDEF domain-containing protein [Polyangia bacterium]|nr:GGDEF domain-containing protein [Polyangia bacterium]